MTVTNGEHRPEHFGDILAHRADEVGDSREVWLTIAGPRDEGDLFDTGSGDGTTRHQTAGVGEQHDLEQRRGRVGGGAESVTDYGLLKSVDLGALFYIINVPLMVGEGLTAFLLFAKRAHAFVVGCVVIIAECVNGMFTSAIAAQNPDTAKFLYVASRAARGMTERPESQLDFMLSPMGIALIALAYLAWWAIVFYYIRRIKPELAQQ